jgi:hypothetical protein
MPGRKGLRAFARRGSLLVRVAAWFLVAACADRTPDPDLTGVWEERDESNVLASLWSFDEKGRFTYDALPALSPDEAEHVSGAYQIVDGHELLLESVDLGAGQRQRTQSSFYTRADKLAPEAFVAVEPQTGLSGCWRSTSMRETFDPSGQLLFHDRRTETFEFQADGHLRLVEQIDDDAPIEITGRYKSLGGDSYQITLDLAQVSISFTYQMVNGEALALRVYRRMDRARSSLP